MGWLISLAVLLGLCALAWLSVSDGLPSAWILVPVAIVYGVGQLAMFRWRISGRVRGIIAVLFVSLIGVAAWQFGSGAQPLAWNPFADDPPPAQNPATLPPGVFVLQTPQVPAPGSGPPPTLGPVTPPPPTVSAPTALQPRNSRYDCSQVVRRERDVGGIRAGFGAGNWRGSMIGLLDQRFPDGAWLVGQLRDPGFFDRWFVLGRADWGMAMTELSTAVHETSHIVGLLQRRGSGHVLVLGEHERLSFPIPRTFHRSEILSHLPQSVRDSTYSGTYLLGQSGAQGFEMVLDELNAYTYSLYVAVAVADELPGNMQQSARDGLLTFMLFTQEYLRLARTDHPDAYRAIETGEIGRAAVRLYDRAECALVLSAPDQNLGIEDAALSRHLQSSSDEVAALRE